MADYLYPNSKILVFAKAPVAGHVKTRMQPVLTAEQSAVLHCDLLEAVLARLDNAHIAPVTLCYAGEHAYWCELKKVYSLTLQPQVSGDLGVRMSDALCGALTKSDSVVLLGGDCPFIERDHLIQAFQALEAGRDVVLGPATDGGYVLLAARQFVGELFMGVDWGTSQVLAQSCAKLDERAIDYSCLSVLADIDRPEDIHLLAGVSGFKRWLSYAP